MAIVKMNLCFVVRRVSEVFVEVPDSVIEEYDEALKRGERDDTLRDLLYEVGSEVGYSSESGRWEDARRGPVVDTEHTFEILGGEVLKNFSRKDLEFRIASREAPLELVVEGK